MLASESASNMTELEAHDLLQKFIAESTRVQAILATDPGLSASVIGKLRCGPNGTIWVLAHDDAEAPHIAFNPTKALIRRYGDRRTFPTTAPRVPHIASGLVFVFDNASQVALFEIDGRI